ncbi:MAG: exodeoxyribonuclease VII small subunit [Myxococcales bacterium]|nr:MAG: exodeoxyribonuclease VII small subunit [Myxococcales bacterium]
MAGKKKSGQSRKDEPKFEEALADLEEVVRQLEEGDVPLEESLTAFERGVALVRLLHLRLDAVQTRVEELTRSERGDLTTREIDDE